MLAGNLAAETGGMAAINLPGPFEAPLARKTLTESSFEAPIIKLPDDPHKSVIQLPSQPVTREPKKHQRKKPGKRGPKGSTYLTMDQVRDVDGLAHVARREGCDFNLCITIRAPMGLSDAEGKRAIDGHVKHIGQALRDRGQIWLAVWVYEKGPHLHAHVLVNVAQRNLKLIKRRHEGSGGIVHVRSADQFGTEYITKQRKWRGPIEKTRIRLWEPCARIEGPRVGYSKAAKALLARSKAFQPASAPVSAGPRTPRLVASNPIETAPSGSAVQMGLPLDWTLRPRGTDAALLAQFSRHFGYSQQQAAERLGYRDRSHVANILRGHDGMSPERRRWVEYLLEPRSMAA